MQKDIKSNEKVLNETAQKNLLNKIYTQEVLQHYNIYLKIQHIALNIDLIKTNFLYKV